MPVKNGAVLVLNHIPDFLMSRGFEAATTPMTDEEYLVALAALGNVVRINARRIGAPNITMSLLVLAPNSGAASRAPELRKLLSGLGHETTAGPGIADLDEVIIIAPNATLEKNNILKEMDLFREAAAQLEPRRTSPAGPHTPHVTYALRPYQNFSLNLLEAACVPKHELLTGAEVTAFLAMQRLPKRELRFISENDPPVIWIGGQAGNVIRVTSASEMAQAVVEYYVVIPGV